MFNKLITFYELKVTPDDELAIKLINNGYEHVVEQNIAGRSIYLVKKIEDLSIEIYFMLTTDPFIESKTKVGVSCYIDGFYIRSLHDKETFSFNEIENKLIGIKKSVACTNDECGETI